MPKILNTNHLILLETAKKLGIKTKILSYQPIKIKYTYNNKTHLITQKSFNINTSKKALKISRNKSLTIQTLALSGLPTPRHATINSPHDYKDIKVPFPQVIKPLFGEKGKHVYLNIKNIDQGQKIITQIFKKTQSVNIETYHQGSDFRFLCLNYKVIGITKRLPPTITGNGRDTIKKLIEKENINRHQQNIKIGKRMLNRMRNWPRLAFNLNLQGLSLKTILPKNKTIQLYPIPNFSTGGSATTIDFKNIHPSLIKLAEKISKTINLQICGIDILIKNLKKPAISNNVTIIEINSDPGLRLHDWPNHGKPQNVAQKILKSIFNI